jgi:uncharacterized membrane protein YeaQ/YmgE (transglycosylase-associated protein family)
MSILAIIVIGALVGGLAKLFMPGKDPGGLIATVVVGIAGSAVAGWFGQSLGWYRGVRSGPGIITSVLGAMLLLLIYRMFARSRTA